MRSAKQSRRWKRSCSRIGMARRACGPFCAGNWSAWTWARRASSITSPYASATARLSITSSVAAVSVATTALSRFSAACLTSRIPGRHASMTNRIPGKNGSMADRNTIMAGERNALRAFRASYNYHHPVVFDIGANVGDYIGEVARYFPAASFYAFEPQPEAIVELEDRFPWIRIERFVVGDIAEGTATLRRDSAKSQHASVHRVSDPALGIFKYTMTAPCCRLDLYCEDQHIKHIHWLKVDVEGHALP